MTKQYIGDGVYANFDGYNIVLTTENGISVTNTIVLEPEVCANLLRFITTRGEEVRSKSSRDVRQKNM